MSESLKKDIGKRIQAARKKRNLTQADIASIMKVSEQAVHKWETGNVSVPVERVSELSEILETSCDWILTGKGTENYVFCNATGLSDLAVASLKNNFFIPLYLNDLLLLKDIETVLSVLYSWFFRWEEAEKLYTNINGTFYERVDSEALHDGAKLYEITKELERIREGMKK